MLIHVTSFCSLEWRFQCTILAGTELIQVVTMSLLNFETLVSLDMERHNYYNRENDNELSYKGTTTNCSVYYNNYLPSILKNHVKNLYCFREIRLRATVNNLCCLYPLVHFTYVIIVYKIVNMIFVLSDCLSLICLD